MAIHRRLDSFSLFFYLLLILWVKTELHQNLPPITSGFQLLRSLSANKHFCRTSRAAKSLYLSWFFLVDPIISPSPVPATAILKFFIIFTPPVFFGPNYLKRCFYLCTRISCQSYTFTPSTYFTAQQQACIQIATTIYTQACPRTSLFCFLLYQLSLWWVKYRAQPEAINP